MTAGRKWMTGLLSLLLLAAAALGLLIPAQAASAGDFSDVSSSAWYYDAVDDCVQNGLFQGTTSTTFSPTSTMTRAMFITVLGRYAGVDPDDWRTGYVTGSGVNLRSGPGTSYSVLTTLSRNTSVVLLGRSGDWYQVQTGSYTGYISAAYIQPEHHAFSDVGYGEYYAGYAIWAYEKGIVNGLGSADTFAPDSSVTREQICSILNRYIESAGLSLAESASGDSFSDDSAISSWAYEDVYAMRRYGIVEGLPSGSFSPKSAATRAEAAVIFQRLSSAIGGGNATDTDTDATATPASTPTATPTSTATATPAATPESVQQTPSISPEEATDTPATFLTSTVSVPAQTIRVGIFVSTRYYDTSVSTVTLENLSGGGFTYGSYSDRVYSQAGTIDSSTVTITTDGSTFTVTDSSGSVVYTSSSSFSICPAQEGDVTRVNGGYRYYGGFEFRQAYYNSGRITLINYVDIEDYVKGVVPYEFPNSWPAETLKAAAIAVRSYVMATSWSSYSTYGFDVICDYGSMIYYGRAKTYSESYFTATDAAVEATENVYLTYNGSICCCYFFSSDGGATEDASHIWGTSYGYLIGRLDPYEAAAKSQITNYSYSVTASRTGSAMASLASSLGLGTIAQNGISVSTYDATGNVESITITDVNGNSAVISRSSSVDRLDFLSAFGFTTYSYRYTVTYDQSSDSFTCTRYGSGHNVGMSQWGAYAMAQYYGKDYQDILGFYYTGTNLQYGA